MSNHPLNDTWCFWLRVSGPKHSDKWNDSLVECYEFSTIEDFWCLINHMNNPFDSSAAVDYSIFRKGVQPDYEAEKLRQGGRVQFKLELPSSNRRSELKEVYIMMLVIIISEVLHEHHGLKAVGVRLVAKRVSDKIEIWTVNQDRTQIEELVREILNKLRTVNEHVSYSVSFESFNKAQKFSIN